MFRSLSIKMAVILLALFIVHSIVFFQLSRYFIDRHMLEVTQRLNRPLADYVIARWLHDDLILPARAVLEEVFAHLMLVNPAVEIYLLDLDGNILSYSADPQRIRRMHVDPAPLLQYVSQQTSMPILGDDPRDPRRRKIFSAAVLPDGSGFLYVVLGGEAFDQLRRESSYVPQLALSAIGVSLLLALLAGLAIYFTSIRRLRRLEDAMDSFRALEFAALGPVGRLDVSSRGDEINRLAATFRQMAERIITQLSMLKETDAARRRLVANVAHDLRTPMASIHGYLETLLIKANDLAPEERRSCVETALKASDRLGRLADELFDLARLDIHEGELTVEPFNLKELAHDIVQELSLAAEERDIEIISDLDGCLPMVEGNIGLIQRVFVNLIDNAIRHNPSGSTVTLRLQPAPDAIEVEIFDNGPGIPTAELEHIFDPLHRVKGLQRADGYGLGLAIVKRILQLHRCDIAADNIPGGGTRFRFALRNVRAKQPAPASTAAGR